MTCKTFRFAFMACIFAVIAVPAASAQSPRTFVSGIGVDGGACSRIAPCRTFSAALTQTTPGGEVVVLDSAGYGPFTVSQAVSIIAPLGVYAGITAFSGEGIDVVAGPTDVVVLRGLTINSQGSNSDGVLFRSAGLLHVESCVVNGFTTNDGLKHIAAGTLEVKDSIFRSNGIGIELLHEGTNTGPAVIDHTRFQGNISYGLDVRNGSTVTVRNSLASGNGHGFVAEANSAKSSELNIENCIVSNNGLGIGNISQSTGVALIRVSNSTVTDNLNSGFFGASSPAVFLSRGNNTVEGNNPNVQGTVAPYSGK